MVPAETPNYDKLPSINIKIVNGDDNTEHSGHKMEMPEHENANDNNTSFIQMKPQSSNGSVREPPNNAINELDFNKGSIIIKKV
jgi:hypothetical protein